MDKISSSISVGISPSYLIDSALIENLDSIPLKKYISSSYNIFISSFYRTISNVSLSSEYEILKENYKITEKSINSLNINAVQSSFLKKSV